MASNAKKKTTMAKLNRERRLRERRAEKQAKKEARRQLAGDELASASDVETAAESIQPDGGENDSGPDLQAHADRDQPPLVGTDRDQV
jgi:hypothetical protein